MTGPLDPNRDRAGLLRLWATWGAPAHRSSGLSQSILARFQAFVDMGGAVSGQDLGFVRFVLACDDFDLFGPPLFGGGAMFGRDRVRVDQLLGKAGIGGGDHQSCKCEPKKFFQRRTPH